MVIRLKKRENLKYILVFFFIILLPLNSKADRYYSANFTNIFESPSEKSKKVDELKAGEVVEVLKEGEDFYKIKTNNGVGYVSKSSIVKGKGLFVLKDRAKLKDEKIPIEEKGCGFFEKGIPGVIIKQDGDWYYVRLILPLFIAESARKKEGWIPDFKIYVSPKEAKTAIKATRIIDEFYLTGKKIFLENLKKYMKDLVNNSPFWKGYKGKLDDLVSKLKNIRKNKIKSE